MQVYAVYLPLFNFYHFSSAHPVYSHITIGLLVCVYVAPLWQQYLCTTRCVQWIWHSHQSVTFLILQTAVQHCFCKQ